MGTTSKPTVTSGFAELLALVLPVSDLTNAGPAIVVEFPDLTGRQTNEDMIAFLGHELSSDTGTADELGAFADLQLDIVYYRAKGNVHQRKTVAGLNIDIVTSHHGITDRNPFRRKNVALLPVGIAEQGDIGGAIGIVLDGDDLCVDAGFVALEVDEPIFAFMATADVTGGQSSVVIPATGFYQAADQAFLRSILGKIRAFCRHVLSFACGRWFIYFDSHDFLIAPSVLYEIESPVEDQQISWSVRPGLELVGEIDLAFRQGHIRLLPVAGKADDLSDSFLLAVDLRSPDIVDLDVEHGLDRLFDFYLVRLGMNLKDHLAIGFLQQVGFFSEAGPLEHTVDVFHADNLFSRLSMTGWTRISFLWRRIS
mgnify:CR=1 FL=1